MHLHDEFPDEQTKLFSLLEGLFVRVVRGSDKQVVDLIFTVGQANLCLVFDNVVDLIEFSHSVKDIVGARQLFALAYRVFLPGVLASGVVKPLKSK